MVMITFPDHGTENQALGFLLGRFSGRVPPSDVHLGTESAMEALADSIIPFFVKDNKKLRGIVRVVVDDVTDSPEDRGGMNGFDSYL